MQLVALDLNLTSEPTLLWHASSLVDPVSKTVGHPSQSTQSSSFSAPSNRHRTSLRHGFCSPQTALPQKVADQGASVDVHRQTATHAATVVLPRTRSRPQDVGKSSCIAVLHLHRNRAGMDFSKWSTKPSWCLNAPCESASQCWTSSPLPDHSHRAVLVAGYLARSSRRSSDGLAETRIDLSSTRRAAIL